MHWLHTTVLVTGLDTSPLVLVYHLLLKSMLLVGRLCELVVPEGFAILMYKTEL